MARASSHRLAPPVNMNESALDQIAVPTPRRLILHLVLRTTATTVCLVALYFLLPVSREITNSTAAKLLAGVTLLVGVIAWQIRAVLRSDYPTLRAVEAIIFTVTIYLLGFAMTYFVMGRDLAENFSEPLTRIDALYFTITVFATVGFGDITARTESARVLVTAQMAGNLVLVGLGLRVLLSAAKIGRERRSVESGE